MFTGQVVCVCQPRHPTPSLKYPRPSQGHQTRSHLVTCDFLSSPSHAPPNSLDTDTEPPVPVPVPVRAAPILPHRTTTPQFPPVPRPPPALTVHHGLPPRDALHRHPHRPAVPREQLGPQHRHQRRGVVQVDGVHGVVLLRGGVGMGGRAGGCVDQLRHVGERARALNGAGGEGGCSTSLEGDARV